MFYYVRRAWLYFPFLRSAQYNNGSLAQTDGTLLLYSRWNPAAATLMSDWKWRQSWLDVLFRRAGTVVPERNRWKCFNVTHAFALLSIKYLGESVQGYKAPWPERTLVTWVLALILLSPQPFCCSHTAKSCTSPQPPEADATALYHIRVRAPSSHILQGTGALAFRLAFF